jgi:hypothetical protein
VFDFRHDSIFTFFHSVQTASRDNRNSYPMGIGGIFQTVRRLRHETDHSRIHLPMSRMMELILHFPIRVSGIVDNYLGIGTVLLVLKCINLLRTGLLFGNLTRVSAAL